MTYVMWLHTIPIQANSYKLEYMEHNNPGVWKIISQGTDHIMDGKIASFNSGVLSERGDVDFRLTIYKDLNLNYSFILKNVYFDPTFKKGWPVKVYGINVQHPGYLDFQVVDLNKDEKKEIIFSTAENSLKIYILNENGSYMPGWPVSVQDYTGGSLGYLPNGNLPKPSVGDIDNDGYPEILITSVLENQKLYAFHLDGSQVSGFPVNLPSIYLPAPYDRLFSASRSSISLEDLNRDGYLDILVFAEDPGFIMIYDRYGNPLISNPILTENNYISTLVSNPSIANLDDDPELEIVFPSIKYYRLGNGTESLVSYLKAINIDGTNVSGWPVVINNEVIINSPAIGDVDNDGENEISIATINGAGLYVFEKNGSVKEGWPVLSGIVSFVGSPILSDVNNDGYLEIVIGGGNTKGITYVFNNAGILIGSWYKDTEDEWYPVNHKSALAIENNQNQDLIFDQSGPRIYGWNEQGNLLNDFPKRTPSYGTTSFGSYVGDIDHDGRLELVSGGLYNLPQQYWDYDKSLVDVFVWDLNITSGEKEWPQFHHDAQHTGLYTKSYKCGDANGNGGVEISDVVYLIAYIFSGGPTPNPLLAGDANGNGNVDVSDAVYLISYIFSGGPAPCASSGGGSYNMATGSEIKTLEQVTNYMNTAKQQYETSNALIAA